MPPRLLNAAALTIFGVATMPFGQAVTSCAWLCEFQSPMRRSNSSSGLGRGTLRTIRLLTLMGLNPPPAFW